MRAKKHCDMEPSVEVEQHCMTDGAESGDLCMKPLLSRSTCEEQAVCQCCRHHDQEFAGRRCRVQDVGEVNHRKNLCKT